MIRIVVILFVLILSVPQGSEARTLIITTLDNPPQAYLENNVPEGFLVDVISAAVRRSGNECKILVVPWKRALRMVKKGSADAVFNAGYTSERNKYLFYLSNVLVTEKVVAFRRAESSVYLKPDLLNGRNFAVGIGRGFYYGKLIQDKLDSNGFRRVEDVPNIEWNMKKLQAGRIDLFFGDYFPAMKFLNDKGSDSGVELITHPEDDSTVIYARSDTYLAFSRKNVSPVLAEKINKELIKMKEDGEYEAIINKYIADYKDVE